MNKIVKNFNINNIFCINKMKKNNLLKINKLKKNLKMINHLLNSLKSKYPFQK